MDNVCFTGFCSIPQDLLPWCVALGNFKNNEDGGNEVSPFQIVFLENFREKWRQMKMFLRERGWSEGYSGSWLIGGWGGSKMKWSRGILSLDSSSFWRDTHRAMG